MPRSKAARPHFLSLRVSALLPALALAFTAFLLLPATSHALSGAPQPSESELRTVAPFPGELLSPAFRSDWFDDRLAELSAELDANLGSPRMAATLYRLDELREDLQSLQPLVRLYYRVLRDRRTHPDIQALARHLLARTEQSRGRLTQARAHFAELGFATEGWVVGGFDNEGGSGHHTAFPPEGDTVDLAAVYEGKEHEIHWLKAPAAGIDGHIPVHQVLRPRRNSTFYFLTRLDSSKAGLTRIYLGTSGATRLWVNGQQVSEDSADHPARFDQRAVEIPLQKGENFLLLKISGREHSPAVFLRLAEKEDWIEGFVAPEQETLQLNTAKAGVGKTGTRSARGSGEADDVLRILERLVAASPRDGELLQDYARVLEARRNFDSKTRRHLELQDKAIALLRNSPEALTTRAAWSDHDHNERKRHLEKALKLDPLWLPARLALGEYYQRRGDERKAREHLEKAFAQRPDHPVVVWRLASALEGLNLSGRGQRLLYSLAARMPSSPLALHAVARLERDFGRRDAAIARYRVLLSQRYDHSARGELLSLLLEGGEVEEALAQGATMRMLDPANIGLGMRLASIMASNGKEAEAAALYDELVAQSPFDEALIEERGHLKFQLGDDAGALADFERSLHLRPQNPGLRETVRSVLPQEQFAVPYLRDALVLAAKEQANHGQVKAAAGANSTAVSGDLPSASRGSSSAETLSKQRAKAGKDLATQVTSAKSSRGKARGKHSDSSAEEDFLEGADTLVLANVEVVRVYQNGLSSRVRQTVAKVLTPAGAEALRVSGIRYTPGQQEVRVEKARIIRPDGSVSESASQHDRRITESWSGMYFDARQRLVAFQDLRVGDVVELTYRLDDVSAENMFADYFGDLRFLQSSSPQRDLEYVLIAPASREFFTNDPGLKGFSHRVEQGEGGRKIWRFGAQNIPRLKNEPRMPGWANIIPHLHISTFRDWDHMAQFWWGLIEDQLHITPEVAKAAKEASAGVSPGDTTGLVHAVHRYVLEKTRYVGLEFGIHGFKPYRVDQVLSRRFGDCKDKAALMYAMLKHLGVDSRMVLIRTRNLGHLAEAPVSLAVFNHAILYVPGLDLFLDGTAEFSGPSELPFSDQNAQALIVEPDPSASSRFLITPAFGAEANHNQSHLQIRLAADQSASMLGQTTIKGQEAPRYRQAYESESGRRERFEQGYGRSYPGAQVRDFEISNSRAIEDDVTLRFALEIPRLAQSEADGSWSFSPFGEPLRYAQWLTPLSKREHPLDLGHAMSNSYQIEIELPSNMVLAEKETRLEKSGEFGSYLFTLEAVPAQSSAENATGDGAPTNAGGALGVRGNSEAPEAMGGDAEGGRQRVLITTSLRLEGGVVSPEQYPALRSFLRELDRAFSYRLRLKPKFGDEVSDDESSDDEGTAAGAAEAARKSKKITADAPRGG